MEMTTTMFAAPETLKPGQQITILGTEWQIETVKPKTIPRDEYGRPIDFPGVEITATQIEKD